MSAKAAVVIANHFLALAHRDQRPVSPLKLQKLLYFAQGYHLGITGQPLFDEPIEAWKFGPVVASVYREFKQFGSSAIDGSRAKIAFDDHEPLGTFLQRIWTMFKDWNPIALSELSHREGGPWDRAVKVAGKMSQHLRIPEEFMIEYFSQFVKPST